MGISFEKSQVEEVGGGRWKKGGEWKTDHYPSEEGKNDAEKSRGRGEEREWNANKKKDPSGRERVHEKNETREVVFHRRQRHPFLSSSSSSTSSLAVQVYSYESLLDLSG